ncbi:hypothetical protein AAEX63_06630 [Luteococcus sp. H138]|uniref:hypothetical protein n=1 Tax=unclassified Luteococcus TaxID=2639923 RepID=UPI00313CF248
MAIGPDGLAELGAAELASGVADGWVAALLAAPEGLGVCSGVEPPPEQPAAAASPVAIMTM